MCYIALRLIYLLYHAATFVLNGYPNIIQIVVSDIRIPNYPVCASLSKTNTKTETQLEQRYVTNYLLKSIRNERENFKISFSIKVTADTLF